MKCVALRVAGGKGHGCPRPTRAWGLTAARTPTANCDTHALAIHASLLRFGERAAESKGRAAGVFRGVVAEQFLLRLTFHFEVDFLSANTGGAEKGGVDDLGKLRSIWRSNFDLFVLADELLLTEMANFAIMGFESGCFMVLGKRYDSPISNAMAGFLGTLKTTFEIHLNPEISTFQTRNLLLCDQLCDLYQRKLGISCSPLVLLFAK
jgi:hypothetical protein